MITQKGLEFLRNKEGLRLEAYQCTGKKWTIGYGHTKDVKEGDVCTLEQAEQWLFEDCQDVIKGLQNIGFKRDLNENQWVALLSLIFNIGIGHFMQSTVKKELLKTKWLKSELTKAWKAWRMADGKIDAGLVARRKEETKLFFETV